MIAEPPSKGGENDTAMLVPDGASVGCAGALGDVFGTAEADATDGALSPSTFVATTVHVYVFPFDRLDTVIGDDTPNALPVTPPSDDEHCAVYPLIEEPPLNGGLNDTTTDAFNATTDGRAGASGTPFGTAAIEAGDGALVPSPFVAVTVQV